MTALAPGPRQQYPYTRWNFVVIALDAAFFFAGISFIDPVAVLPVLVGKLEGSNLVVGLLGALQRAGWIVPQIIGASFVLHRPRKKPFVVLPCLVARLPFVPLAIIFSVVQPGSQLQGLLFLLIGVYALFFFSDGLVGVPWHDIIARTIPPNLRGRFFGSINIGAGLLAFASGAVVRRVLSDPSLPFPHNYGLLFTFLCICMALSTFFLALIKEPSGTALDQRQSLTSIVRAIPATLRRHRLLRRVIIAQNIMGIVALALPFYAVYAHSRLHLPDSFGGFFIWAGIAGTMGASLVWAYLNDRRGPLTVLRGVVVAGLAVPLAAIVFPPLARGLGAVSALGHIYSLTFLLNGIAMAGGWMGVTNYVLEIAPDDIRPLFLGLSSTLAAPVVLMPLIGGWLLTLVSYETLFAIAVAGAVIGILYVYSLERPERPAAEPLDGLAATPAPSPTARPTLD